MSIPQRDRWPVSDVAAPGRDTWGPSDAGEAIFRAGFLGTHSSRLHRLSCFPPAFIPRDRPSDLSSEGPEVVMARSQSLGVPTCRRVEGTWGWSGL